MPMTLDIGAPDRRAYAPNHNRPWSTADEDELLRLFALGEPIDRLASFFGRTTGSINARLTTLLGIAWPDTPNAYRSSGRPIRRRGRHMPRQARADADAALTASAIEANTIAPAQIAGSPQLRPGVTGAHPGDWRLYNPGEWAQNPFPPSEPVPPMQQDPPGFFEQAFARVSRTARVRPQRHRIADLVEANPPPSQETPDRLYPVLTLSRKHYEALAAELKALRPPFEGRVATAQHSILNRMAYRLAKLFEGEDSDFDRAKWLTACGVTSTQEGN